MPTQREPENWLGPQSQVVRLRACLVLACLVLFSARCATTIWDPDVSHTGRVLTEGQTEFTGGTAALVLPSVVEIGHGFAGAWELRGRVGEFGLLRKGEGPDWPPSSDGLVGAGLGIGKGLLNHGENRIVILGELLGYASNLRFDSTCLSGGWAGVGGALSQYPFSWLGIFLSLKVSGLLTDRGDRYLRIRPGIGLSLEPRLFVARLGFAPQVRVLSHEVTGPASAYRLHELPFALQASIQLGARWPAETNE